MPSFGLEGWTRRRGRRPLVQSYKAIAKGEYFLLKVEDVHIEDVNRDNFGASRCEPAASGGARDTSPFRVPDVTC